MKNDLPVLHIVQDLATPHNNSLVSALRDTSSLRVVTWYAMRTSWDLPWKEELGIGEDNHYYDSWSNKWRLIRTFLQCPSDKFMVVGYSNFGSCFILIVSWILGRNFMYWSDNPDDRKRSFIRSRIRNFLLHIVKHRGRPIFLVGRHTIENFRRIGFPEDHLVNLPIFIDLPPRGAVSTGEIAVIRDRYGVRSEEVLFVAASRLIYSKGYDLLVEAVSLIEPHFLGCIKVLIVGSGPEKENVRALVRRRHLEHRILFEDWLEPGFYERVLGAADVFVHPARFDAFGGGTLFAMAWGVPVIGSDGAGAALERIESGVNGLLYQAEDIQALSEGLVRLVENPEERKSMGRKARETAEKWPPALGAKIIHDGLMASLS